MGIGILGLLESGYVFLFLLWTNYSWIHIMGYSFV